MTVRETLLESGRQKYPWIVEPVRKKPRFNSYGKPMVELDVPGRPSSARRLSELQYTAQKCKLLAPDYVIYFDANGWIQGHSLFDVPHHLHAQGAVPFEQRWIQFGHATLDFSPQSKAYLQGNSCL